jgi:heat shock protein HtpX
MNALKTGLLMVFVAGLFLAIGFLVGGKTGMVIALLLSLGFNFFAYWNSEKMALSFAKARPVRTGELNWLVQANEEISLKAGIPAPTLHVSPDPQPNAFACGRGPGHASVVINQGLIDSMSEREVIGVLAHEIAHVKNRDVLTMTIVASVSSAIMWVANFAMFFGGGDEEHGPNPLVLLLIMIVGPIAAMLVQMAVSRTREYAADETAAQLMGDGRPLADALRVLSRATHEIPSRTAQPATAHMYIANPLRGGGIASLFSTHPPAEERIARLARMSARAA